MSEEEEEAYIPPSEAQLKWVEKNKAPELSPEELHSETVPEGMAPVEYIGSQLEKAKEVGAVVTYPMEVGEMHDCTCLDCRSGWLPKERKGPGHFGTRFAEADSVIRVFKGEYDQPDAIFIADVIEVDCDEGWAIRVREPVHICHNCWKNWCVWKDTGVFSVIGIPIPKEETA